MASAATTVETATRPGLPVASKNSKNFVPKDLSGSPIPHSQRWVYSTTAIANSKLKSLSASAALIAGYVSFNSSAVGQRFYTHLDDTYGELAVNLWGTFVITTVFF